MKAQTFDRKLVDIQTPQPQPGFLGAGHIARAVIQKDFRESDPFILLMDDFLDKKDDNPVGGPHPHAGFETVSLLLEGEIGDEAHTMQAGDFQIMTAGSGIVHTETIEKKARLRLLQMWINLPKKDRWASPRVQDLTYESVPKVYAPGVEIGVYSGTLAGTTSPVKNHTPFIVADVRMQPGAETVQELPGSYNAFIYVVEGDLEAGENNRKVGENQVGWFSRSDSESTSSISLKAGTNGARVVLYAGEPQQHDIVPYGPFIADSQQEIRDLYADFRHGKMRHVSTLGEGERFRY